MNGDKIHANTACLTMLSRARGKITASPPMNASVSGLFSTCWFGCLSGTGFRLGGNELRWNFNYLGNLLPIDQSPIALLQRLIGRNYNCVSHGSLVLG